MVERWPSFQRVQLGFAAHIRDPDVAPAPADVEPSRMAAYRELFFNNIEHFITSGFPVLKSVLKHAAWVGLVRRFFAQHRCKTPLFIGIAEEFLGYLRDERAGQPGDPPFLLELAHYEWVELALSVDEAEPPEWDANFAGDLLNAVIGLSPLAWRLAYRFPVHRIGPGFMPEEAPATLTYLVVYRDRQDAVRFLELNQVSYRLLELLDQATGQTVRQVLLRIAQELQHPSPQDVLTFGAELLTQLHEKGVLGRCVT